MNLTVKNKHFKSGEMSPTMTKKRKTTKSVPSFWDQRKLQSQSILFGYSSKSKKKASREKQFHYFLFTWISNMEDDWIHLKELTWCCCCTYTKFESERKRWIATRIKLMYWRPSNTPGERSVNLLFCNSTQDMIWKKCSLFRVQL